MSNTGEKESAIKQKNTEVIKSSAARAEKDGKFSKPLVNLINEEKWTGLFTPTTYGGLQAGIPEGLQILEAIAKADGSAGWAVTNSALAGWQTGFVNAAVVKEITGKEKPLLAGTTAATGTAEKSKTGYTINGTWSHVANAGEAAAFSLKCVVTKNGTPVKDDANKNQVISVVLLQSEVTISAAGETMGLVAATSSDVAANSVKVASDRTFSTDDAAKVKARLYEFPYLQLTEAALAVNIAGMAAHFTDLYDTMIAGVKTPVGLDVNSEHMVQDTYEKHVLKMKDAHMKLYYAVELAWEACTNRRPIKDTILYKVSSAAQELTKRARECVDAIYPFCGIAAMERNSDINRVWRDLHTAAQDGLLVFGGL